MTSLFNVTNDDDLQIDPNKDYLSELVGDDKKFKTTADLAKAKAESDAYIKLLLTDKDETRAEMTRLRDEATTKVQLQTLIDQLKQPNSSSEHTPAKEENTPLYDPKAVESLIYSKIQESELQKKQQDNFNTVVGKLKEKFGTNFQNHLKQKTLELGLTDDAVENMARTMPQVLIRSLELDAPAQRDLTAPPRSMYRTDTFAPRGGDKRDYAFYQKMRRETPELYYDAKTTVQRHKDVQTLGEKDFYGQYYDAE